jgi:cysteine desulfurase
MESRFHIFILSASEGSVFPLIQTAREQVAELIGAHSLDIIFTSCATESNNAAIAAALRAKPTKRHIVSSQVEHSSLLNYCMALEKQSQDSPQSTLREQGRGNREQLTNFPPCSSRPLR